MAAGVRPVGWKLGREDGQRGIRMNFSWAGRFQFNFNLRECPAGCEQVHAKIHTRLAVRGVGTPAPLFVSRSRDVTYVPLNRNKWGSYEEPRRTSQPPDVRRIDGIFHGHFARENGAFIIMAPEVCCACIALRYAGTRYFPFGRNTQAQQVKRT